MNTYKTKDGTWSVSEKPQERSFIKASGWFFMTILTAILYVPVAIFVWVFDR